MMQHFSLLDLSPIPEGKTAADALAASADLARAAERLGFHRFWLAEHHNMPGIASAATAVVIGHVAAATRSIRVGAGGIWTGDPARLVTACRHPPCPGTADACPWGGATKPESLHAARSPHRRQPRRAHDARRTARRRHRGRTAHRCGDPG